MKLFIAMLILLCSPLLHAAPQCDAPKVIYMTFDGIDPNEITQSHFPYLLKTLLPLGDMISANNDKRIMITASIPVSLPSYLTQMTGTVVPCINNFCGRAKTETLPESIKKHLKLDKDEVATFASWPDIDKSVERVSGTSFVNTGNQWDNLPFSNPMIKAERANMTREKLDISRKDKLTFSLALSYLKQKQPRFLWISLVQSDDLAHEGDRDSFNHILTVYDDMLKTLSNTLSTDPCLKNTWVVVTTDHGRGLGDDWVEHGAMYPHSFNTWFFVFHAKAIQSGVKVPSPYDLNQKAYTTLVFKPMIETMLGIK